ITFYFMFRQMPIIRKKNDSAEAELKGESFWHGLTSAIYVHIGTISCQFIQLSESILTRLSPGKGNVTGCSEK
ncbi:MAG TPA: hypothetical protein VEH09_09900, partial [Thermodesulfobacteriota bacterium]|nr:hypothetical protein [Thermodesulfobacteriota bacterium]